MQILANTYFSLLSNGCLKHVQLASNNLAICLVAMIRSLAAHEDIISRRKDKGSHYLTNAPRNRRQTFLPFSSFHFFFLFISFSPPFLRLHVLYTSHDLIMKTHDNTYTTGSFHYITVLPVTVTSRRYRLHASRDIHLHFEAESLSSRWNNDSLFQRRSLMQTRFLLYITRKLINALGNLQITR